MRLIQTLYPEYFCDDKIVFKSCGKIWIVVLEKLDTTRTTEKRNVHDKKYAKFRGDKFKVLNIINKIDPSVTINTVENSIFKDKTIKYVKNEIIETEFDDDLNNVCSKGIHYYVSIEPAFSLEFDMFILDNKVSVGRYNLNEKMTEYDEDGNISCIYNLKNGFIDGKLQCFDGGKLIKEITYNEGTLQGKCIFYDKHGNILREINYMNNVEHGLHKIFYKNKLMFEEKYIDGEVIIY